MGNTLIFTNHGYIGSFEYYLILPLILFQNHMQLKVQSQKTHPSDVNWFLFLILYKIRHFFFCWDITVHTCNQEVPSTQTVTKTLWWPQVLDCVISENSHTSHFLLFPFSLRKWVEVIIILLLPKLTSPAE